MHTGGCHSGRRVDDASFSAQLDLARPGSVAADPRSWPDRTLGASANMRDCLFGHPDSVDEEAVVRQGRKVPVSGGEPWVGRRIPNDALGLAGYRYVPWHPVNPRVSGPRQQ